MHLHHEQALAPPATLTVPVEEPPAEPEMTQPSKCCTVVAALPAVEI